MAKERLQFYRVVYPQIVVQHCLFYHRDHSHLGRRFLTQCKGYRIEFQRGGVENIVVFGDHKIMKKGQAWHGKGSS